MYKVRNESKTDQKKKRGGAKPSARLSDLRWIRTRWKRLEEDTSLVYKERERSTACFRAKDVVHVCVVAEVTSAWVVVDGAMDECVLAGERATALAGDVVVGVGAVFEGVSGSKVVVGEAACTGGVQLPVTVVILLPSINSDEKMGVVPGPGYAGHWSVSTKPNIVVIFFKTFAFLATFSSSLLIVLRMYVLNNTSTIR